jgi:hypothetical protein
MSIDERRVHEALTSYAEGVVMTSTDVDRMQRDLHRRLREGRRPGGRRVLLAAAAAVLVVAAVVAGVWWVRKPAAPVPATPPPAGSLTGLWKFSNALATSLFVITDDNTATEYPNSVALLRRIAGDPVRVTNDGRTIGVEGRDAQGQLCRTEQAIVAQSDGFVAQGVQTLTGPGCPVSTQPESTLVRLSPASAATRDLPVSTEEPGMPVTDAVQLNGVWLLQGTGLVLAVDEKAGPAAYLMDNDGDIATAPDAQGAVSVEPNGQVVLAGSGCGTSTLGRAEVRGQGVQQSLTATAVADPCGLFDGRSTLVWIRVL